MNWIMRHWPAFVLAFALFPIMGMVAFAQEAADDPDAAQVTSNAVAINAIPTDIIMWSAIVSVIAPIIIGLLNKPTMSSGAKGLVTVVVCVILGGATAFFAGDLSSAKDTVTAMLVVFTGAITFYHRFFGPTNIANALERVPLTGR
jgi:hypothetical protein